MDSAGSWKEKATEMLKQVEDMRMMLSNSSLNSDLRALRVDMLKILCEERGINVIGQSKGPHKKDLIESLKV
jgi:hypothetical protein